VGEERWSADSAEEDSRCSAVWPYWEFGAQAPTHPYDFTRWPTRDSKRGV